MTSRALDLVVDAYNNSNQSKIVSSTIYEFQLDKQLLVVQDNDFVLRVRDTPFAAGQTLPIKQIRRTPSAIRASVFALPDVAPTARSQLLKQPVVTTFCVDATRKESRFELSIRNCSDTTCSLPRNFRISLQYEVPLESAGNLLMFAGAIQPSDYVEPRSLLGIESASKLLHVFIHSSNALTGYIYSPDAMNYFPTAISSSPYGKNRHAIRSDLERIDGSWDRATYFAVAVTMSANGSKAVHKFNLKKKAVR